MMRSHLRLPDIDDPSTLGRWLVRHIVGLTLGSLLLLSVLAVVALSTVQVEQTVQVAGTLERLPSGELGARLRVPAAAAAEVAVGQAVRVQPPSPASPPLNGWILSVGSAPASPPVPVVATVTLEFENGVEMELGAGMEGSIVQARIVTGSQRAGERLLASLKRKSRV